MRLLEHKITREARSSSMRFSKGDVLYGKMRPYLNKVWVAEFDGLCSAEFLVFKKHERLNNEFLASRLNSEDFVLFANAQVSGERPRVDFEKLSHFEIGLPPLAEQARIMAKLRAALSKVERAEIAAKRARTRLGRYRIAVLDSSVRGELTRDWREAPTLSGTSSATSEPLLQRILVARRTRWEQAALKRLPAGTARNDDKWKSRYQEGTLPKTHSLPQLPDSWSWISISPSAVTQNRPIVVTAKPANRK